MNSDSDEAPLGGHVLPGNGWFEILQSMLVDRPETSLSKDQHGCVNVRGTHGTMLIAAGENETLITIMGRTTDLNRDCLSVVIGGGIAAVSCPPDAPVPS